MPRSSSRPPLMSLAEPDAPPGEAATAAAVHPPTSMAGRGGPRPCTRRAKPPTSSLSLPTTRQPPASRPYQPLGWRTKTTYPACRRLISPPPPPRAAPSGEESVAARALRGRPGSWTDPRKRLRRAFIRSRDAVAPRATRERDARVSARQQRPVWRRSSRPPVVNLLVALPSHKGFFGTDTFTPILDSVLLWPPPILIFLRALSFADRKRPREGTIRRDPHSLSLPPGLPHEILIIEPTYG